jgi:hypothetical protein
MHAPMGPAHEFMSADLAKSGLIAQDIGARVLESAERAMTNIPHSVNGYVIPYWDITGRPLPFYRVRLHDHTPKYKQPKETQNHVYFPKGFWTAVRNSAYILVTEGEKKAALATKLGHPAVAFGGVDSWRNRIVILPKDTELVGGSGRGSPKIRAKMGAGGEAEEDTTSLANGLETLIAYAIENEKHILICYDTDIAKANAAYNVQRAAANFGFELRFRGIPFSHIRQIHLPEHLDKAPPLEHHLVRERIALDDILTYDKGLFDKLLTQTLKARSAFPKHPNLREYINKQLQNPRLTRRHAQQVAMAILCDLDSNGLRMRATKEGQSYYFDNRTRRLIKTQFSGGGQLAETDFGRLVYRRYGISIVDERVMQWLGAQFTGEDPIEEVSPHRVFARHSVHDDCVYYQCSDAKYVKVSRAGVEFFDNGELGTLFEAEQVTPLDVDILQSEYNHQMLAAQKAGRPPFWWAEVLSDVRLRDRGRGREITALLYYMSPWLYKWRGLQLPIELILGESGSGKSTLCELRLSVLTGEPRLRNAPQDLKDWHASISNAGGLHVTDNVQLVDRSLRQRLSDDICRIITEPDPHIEMRKYYTNADLMRVPVRAVFAVTAIQQPFQQADLLQRSLILEFSKTPNVAQRPDVDPHEEITYDSFWRQNKMNKYGGREAWVAHHLVALTFFFRAVNVKWDPNYRAKHRLINLEQSFKLMAEVFGVNPDWIPNYLVSAVDEMVTESDWTLEGLQAFARAHRWAIHSDKRFGVNEIAEWAMFEDEYSKCENLANSRRLGRYMKTHAALIQQIAGIMPGGQANNRQLYRIIDVRPRTIHGPQDSPSPPSPTKAQPARLTNV